SSPPRDGGDHLRRIRHRRAVGRQGHEDSPRRRDCAHPAQRGAWDVQRGQGYARVPGDSLSHDCRRARTRGCAQGRALALAQNADGVPRVTSLPILLIGTFDTKGDEYAFVRSIILERGHRVLTMNLGIMSDSAPFPVDITATE